MDANLKFIENPPSTPTEFLRKRILRKPQNRKMSVIFKGTHTEPEKAHQQKEDTVMIEPS